METREKRRAATRKKAQRAKREHERVVGARGMPFVRPVGYFKKRGTLSCDCRHRHHGNPKVGRGCCTRSMDWRPAVEERIAGKRFCRKWAAGELPEEA